jgi:hypothetical protein
MMVLVTSSRPAQLWRSIVWTVIHFSCLQQQKQIMK